MTHLLCHNSIILKNLSVRMEDEFMDMVKEYLQTLDEEIYIDKKLLLFEFLTVFLCGILLGIITSPYRSVSICSNNENIGNNDD